MLFKVYPCVIWKNGSRVTTDGIFGRQLQQLEFSQQPDQKFLGLKIIKMDGFSFVFWSDFKRSDPVGGPGYFLSLNSLGWGFISAATTAAVSCYLFPQLGHGAILYRLGFSRKKILTFPQSTTLSISWNFYGFELFRKFCLLPEKRDFGPLAFKVRSIEKK